MIDLLTETPRQLYFAHQHPEHRAFVGKAYLYRMNPQRLNPDILLRPHPLRRKIHQRPVNGKKILVFPFRNL